MCPSIFTKAHRLLPAQIHDSLPQNLQGWVFLCIDRISKKGIMGNTQQNYLRPAQLVKPQSEMHDWLVTWPSAGEDLFLLIPIWRWDNRVRQLCYMFSGSSQHVLYPKECQEALWREKQKCILPRGLIPDSESEWEDLLLCGERGLGFPKSGQRHRPESCHSFFLWFWVLGWAWGLRTTPTPFPSGILCCRPNIDRIVQVSPCPRAVELQPPKWGNK